MDDLRAREEYCWGCFCCPIRVARYGRLQGIADGASSDGVSAFYRSELKRPRKESSYLNRHLYRAVDKKDHLAACFFIAALALIVQALSSLA